MKIQPEKIALKERISFLEEKKAKDLLVLKLQYRKTIDSFNPVSQLKTSIKELIIPPHLKSIVIIEIIKFCLSYFNKTLSTKHSNKPMKKAIVKIVLFELKKCIEKQVRKV